jgi:hypothetical protein
MQEPKTVPRQKHSALYRVEALEFTVHGGFSMPDFPGTATCVLRRLDLIGEAPNPQPPQEITMKGTFNRNFPQCGDEFRMSLTRVKKARRTKGRV